MNKYISKANEAAEIFSNGFNCAQAVLSAFCKQYGVDKEVARKISCGFGGGMGRLGETCGAVSGAYLVIGLQHGQATENDDAAKETTYRLVQEFSNRFTERNSTTTCRELLGVDLLTGDKNFAAKQVKTICPQMVRDAVEILEEILDE